MNLDTRTGMNWYEWHRHIDLDIYDVIDRMYELVYIYIYRPVDLYDGLRRMDMNVWHDWQDYRTWTYMTWRTETKRITQYNNNKVITRERYVLHWKWNMNCIEMRDVLHWKWNMNCFEMKDIWIACKVIVCHLYVCGSVSLCGSILFTERRLTPQQY